MAKAWTAPEGDVKPDPIETKIKILRAEVNKILEVDRVIGAIASDRSMGEEASLCLESAITYLTFLITDLEEQREQS